uniref:Uncharacterized protein n=1 Tax=Daucus carota subsp. sativus TaxID=79200 RepID=A0A166GUW6_DAUCS
MGPKPLHDYDLLDQIGSAGKDASWPVRRLRHPGVLHVVEALDDSKNALVMVTELLFASVANVLGNVDTTAKVPKELKGMVVETPVISIDATKGAAQSAIQYFENMRTVLVVVGGMKLKN